MQIKWLKICSLFSLTPHKTCFNWEGSLIYTVNMQDVPIENSFLEIFQLYSMDFTEMDFLKIYFIFLKIRYLCKVPIVICLLLELAGYFPFRHLALVI